MQRPFSLPGAQTGSRQETRLRTNRGGKFEVESLKFKVES
jgi:hypothetical protein